MLSLFGINLSPPLFGVLSLFALELPLPRQFGVLPGVRLLGVCDGVFDCELEPTTVDELLKMPLMVAATVSGGQAR